MIIVKLPDGSTAQFPDGTSKEVMQAAIAKKFPPQQVEPGNLPDGSQPWAQPTLEQRFAARRGSPNLLDATLATANGLAASVPFLQPATDAIGGGIAQLTGGNFNDYVKHQQDVRAGLAKKAPVSRVAGQIAGTMAGTGAIGATPAGAQALGTTGTGWQQLGNAILSGAGLAGLQGVSEGKQGGELLTDMAVGGGASGVGNLVGRGVSALGQKASDAVTNLMQRGATAKATVGAPTASELKSMASEMFDQATGGQPIMVTDNAYFRLLGNIKNVADKFRINPQNDPQSTGLLETLMRIADDTASGTRVDIKDLHLIRQLAQKVAQGNEGRDKAFGSLVINQMDDFIKSLKPADILGEANPSSAAKALMTGISTWSRASKVSAVEEAIKNAETYKSGVENGLKLSFLKLMKDPIFSKFNEAEKQAIRDVANGTAGQNIAGLIGKLGVSFTGSSAHNIIGSGVGTTGLTAALTPVLGPAALPAAFAGTTAAGMVGRNIAQNIATQNAARAAAAVATPNIPIVQSLPNLLAGPGLFTDLLIRGTGQALAP